MSLTVTVKAWLSAAPNAETPAELADTPPRRVPVRVTPPSLTEEASKGLPPPQADRERASATVVASLAIPDADLQADGATVEVAWADLPAGTHQLTGFLDDNDNVDPNDPGPDKGDLVAAEGFGPDCTTVVIEDAPVAATLDLNFVMPF